MVISIYKFLATYYGITLDICKECSHKQIKKEFSFLRGCSFKYAKANQEMISDGTIIYVRDDFGKIIPYIAPKEIKVSNKECEYTESKIDYDDDLYNIKELPTYILRKLLSRYKYKPSIYRIIKNELINRGVYQNKIYKIEKEIEKINCEESEKNDKYKRRRKIKCY